MRNSVDQRISLLRRAIALAEAGRWSEAKALIAELEATAHVFYGVAA